MKSPVFISLLLLVLVITGAWFFHSRTSVEQGSPEILLEKIEDMSNTVKLYYYNPSKDQDEKGNILCSENGLEAVERKVSSASSIQDILQLLLQGKLTSEEKGKGITTEYPLPGFELKNTLLENGLLTLTFTDPQNKTSGGSCRVVILRSQIEATAKQFSGVTEVHFVPEDLFQP